MWLVTAWLPTPCASPSPWAATSSASTPRWVYTWLGLPVVLRPPPFIAPLLGAPSGAAAPASLPPHLAYSSAVLCCLQKHIDDVPELKAEKQAMNRRTLKAMQVGGERLVGGWSGWAEWAEWGARCAGGCRLLGCWRSPSPLPPQCLAGHGTALLCTVPAPHYDQCLHF